MLIFYLQSLIFPCEFILKYLAMHHILILVDQVARGVSWSTGGAPLSEEIKFLSAIGGQGVGEDYRVVGTLLHGVDVCVYI